MHTQFSLKYEGGSVETRQERASREYSVIQSHDYIKSVG
jgi:hypothetical protein